MGFVPDSLDDLPNGTLPASRVTGLTASLPVGTSTGTVAAGDDARIVAAYSHTSNTSNPHAVTAAQVGAYTTAQADTLLAAKASSASLATHTADTANPHGVTKAQVGLGSVDNTADTAKPVSTAQAASIALRALDSATVHNTGAETVAGTKTFSTTIVGSVSGNAGTVTNGVVTTGSYSDPAWLASLAGSKVTGTVAQGNLPAPGTTTGTYADGGTVTTNTANIALKAPLASPTFTGTITGNGSGLTALSGSQVTTGTVAQARLPAPGTAAGTYADGGTVATNTTAIATKLTAASNLSDLASAATARTNLGLGGAAVLSVGTAAGTVADAGAVATEMKFAGWSLISDRPCKTTARVANSSITGTSFRTACTPAFSGTAIRLVYANWFNRATGETPNTNSVYIQAATQPAGSAVNELAGDPVYMATFGGKDYLTLPGGRFAVSDPIQMPFAAAIRFYVKTYVNSTLAAGPSAPTLAASGSGSSWGAGTYTVSQTYVFPGGHESAASATASVVLTAGQNIVVTNPASVAGCVGLKTYVSAAGTATPQYDSGAGVVAFGTTTTLSVAPPSGVTEAVPQVEGGNQYYPTGGWVSGGALPGGANNGEGFVNSVNRVADGRAVTFGNSTNIFAPVAILGLDPAKVHGSVALLGDSILAGSYDMGYGGTAGGFGVRACAAQTGRAYSASITPNCGFTNLAQFGESAQSFAGVGGVKRAQMAGLATAVVEEYGTNDMRTGSRSAAQTLGDCLTIAGRHTSRQQKVVRTTITPVTNSSDGYTTVSGQSYAATQPEGNRRQFNNVIRSGTGAVAVTGEAPFVAIAGTPGPSTNLYAGGNGAATLFLTAYPFATGTEAVTVAGVSKAVTTDYTYFATAVIGGTTYASGITFLSAPASGAAVLISYTKMPGYLTLAGSYARVSDTAAAVEVDSTGTLTANGGWWPGSGSALVAARAVTSAPTSTALVDSTQAWTQDQWKGYCVRIVTDTTTPGAVNQVKCILSNTATTLTLYSGHNFTTTPSSACTYAIEDQYCVDGLHATTRGAIATAVPLTTTLNAEVVS